MKQGCFNFYQILSQRGDAETKNTLGTLDEAKAFVSIYKMMNISDNIKLVY